MVIRGYVRISQTATQVAYVGMLLLLIGGAGAATVNALWSQPWVWGSVVVLIAVILAMYAVGARYYYRLRDLLAGNDDAPPISPEALANYLDSRVPDILDATGGVGLLALVGLMVMKAG